LALLASIAKPFRVEMTCNIVLAPYANGSVGQSDRGTRRSFSTVTVLRACPLPGVRRESAWSIHRPLPRSRYSELLRFCQIESDRLGHDTCSAPAPLRLLRLLRLLRDQLCETR